MAFDFSAAAGAAVVFNVKGAGYYRVTYDDANWLAIASALQANPDNIGVENRAQILSDALNVARYFNIITKNLSIKEMDFLWSYLWRPENF